MAIATKPMIALTVRILRSSISAPKNDNPTSDNVGNRTGTIKQCNAHAIANQMPVLSSGLCFIQNALRVEVKATECDSITFASDDARNSSNVGCKT